MFNANPVIILNMQMMISMTPFIKKKIISYIRRELIFLSCNDLICRMFKHSNQDRFKAYKDLLSFELRRRYSHELYLIFTIIVSVLQLSWLNLPFNKTLSFRKFLKLN